MTGTGWIGEAAPIERCVRIWHKSQRRALGSGFRLSSDRVVTCFHVIHDCAVEDLVVREPLWGDQLEPSQKDAESLPGPGWRETCVRGIAWQPDLSEAANGEIPKLDAVLLATDEVGGVLPWAQFLEKRLEVEVPWQAFGFPGSRRNSEDRTRPYGTASPFLDRDQRFQLAVEAGYQTEAAGWRGISGSAVLGKVPGRDGMQVLGLVLGGWRESGGRSLQALPWSAVWGVDAFRAEVRLSERRERWVPLRSRVAALLRGEVTAAIAKEEPWKDLPTEARALARELCSTPELDALTSGLSNAFVDLVRSGRPEIAEGVFEILHLALPAAYGAGHPDLAGPESREARIEAVSDMLIEIANAAIDERPVRFSEGSSKLGPHPTYRVQVPPVAGADPYGDEVEKVLARELSNTVGIELGAAGGGKTVLDLVIRLVTRSVAPDQGAVLTGNDVNLLRRLMARPGTSAEDAFVELVNEAMAVYAEMYGRFYVVDEEADGQDPALIGKLTRRFGELRRVELGPSSLGTRAEKRIDLGLQKAHLTRDEGKDQL